MINLKKVISEDRDKTVSHGCLMAMVTEPHSDIIKEFNQKVIPERKLYVEGHEFGRESEPHITIKYGFTKDLTELDIRRIMKDQSTFMVELKELNHFSSNPLFDVAIFKVESPVLRELNKRCCQYPNEDQYPEYKPHLTLAYIKKGEFPIVKENMRLVIPIRMVCYSPIQGGKSYYNL